MSRDPAEAANTADRAAAILSEMKLEGEVYLEDTVVTSVTVSGGKIESIETKEELGAGLRLFDGGRVGFAYTADLTAHGVRQAALAAKSFAGETDPDPAAKLLPPEPVTLPDPDGGDAGMASMEIYRKAALARAMEEAARAVDPRVKKVRQARYTDVVGRVEIRNSLGLARGGSFARVYGAIEVQAEEGDEAQSGWANEFALKISAFDPFKIGREAARRAIAKLGGKKCATRRTDVVLDPEVTGSLLEAFSSALSAENVLKGKSAFAGRIGQKIAGEGVGLVDDGRFPAANRTFPFDGEGAPTRRTILVERGHLKGYLHNAWSSSKMGTRTTGNAFRASYSGPPRIASTTLYFVPEGISREEIMTRAEKGVLITEVMGLHTVDPITGEFSLGAMGHEIEGGHPGASLTGIGIAGNMVEFLGAVQAVGSDLRLLPSGTAGSTLLVRSVTISGA